MEELTVVDVLGSSPFKIVKKENVVVIGELDKVMALSDNGRFMLNYVSKHLYSDWCLITVRTVCQTEFKEVNETYSTRIRRGIRNLIKFNILAKSEKADIYWVNPNVLWRQ